MEHKLLPFPLQTFTIVIVFDL